MQKLAFNIPVLVTQSNYAIPPQKKHLAKIIDFIESYFCWSGKFYKIDSGATTKGHKYIFLSNEKHKKKTIVKIFILATSLTLVIPIFIFALKIIHRKLNKFIVIKQPKNLINIKSISQKAIPIPVPSTEFSDYTPTDVAVYAESLNIGKDNVDKLKRTFDLIQTSENNLVWTYMRAILKEFDITQINEEFKKDILINIARDSGTDTCNEGKLTKIQKEYARLFGADEDSVMQNILFELEDLKLEFINQIAIEMIPRDYAFHPHFLSAACVFLSNTLGLDANRGRTDPLYTSSRVAPHFDKQRKHLIINRFLELYKPNTLLQWLHQSLNGKKDKFGITMNIGLFYKEIITYLQKNGYKKPFTYKELLQGPLKNHIDKTDKKTSLKTSYEIALDNFISEKYFKKATSDPDLIKEIKIEGVEILLKSLKIFE